jgi:hypothetical protein
MVVRGFRHAATALWFGANADLPGYMAGLFATDADMLFL